MASLTDQDIGNILVNTDENVGGSSKIIDTGIITCATTINSKINTIKYYLLLYLVS
jgi:hypothetical protein